MERYVKWIKWVKWGEQGAGFSLSLPYHLDIRGHDPGNRPWLLCSRDNPFHPQPADRHDLNSHCHRPDTDDVSTSGQGQVRGAGTGLYRSKGPGPLPGSELDRGPHSDVRPGSDLPAGLASSHEWHNPHRPCPLHRHGHRLERAGLRLHRVLRRPGGTQLHISGVLLLHLCIHLHHRPAGSFRNCSGHGR